MQDRGGDSADDEHRQWRPATGPAGEQNAPQLNVLGQYIKDFSFENPNAPRSLAPS
ncbi:MAG: protein-export chaperone SecB, partial [Xanthobacteraceae bacterium]